MSRVAPYCAWSEKSKSIYDVSERLVPFVRMSVLGETYFKNIYTYIIYNPVRWSASVVMRSQPSIGVRENKTINFFGKYYDNTQAANSGRPPSNCGRPLSNLQRKTAEDKTSKVQKTQHTAANR